MDFFAEQDRSRRNTRRLIWLFALAVVVLIALTNLAVALGLWLMDAQLLGQWDYVHQDDTTDVSNTGISFAEAGAMNDDSLEVGNAL